jgi:hypothetical protein
VSKKSFQKLTGKQFAYTFDNVYQFNGIVVKAMNEVRAWGNGCHAAVHVKGKYEFHLIIAENARYFKYDGPGSPEICVNLFCNDTEDNEAWMVSCLIPWNAKETKKYIRELRNRALEMTTEKIEEIREQERSAYTWRYATETPKEEVK